MVHGPADAHDRSAVVNKTGPAHLQCISRAHGMRQLRGERGADGVEVERLAAVVDGHLAALAGLQHVAEALHPACDLSTVWSHSYAPESVC